MSTVPVDVWQSLDEASPSWTGRMEPPIFWDSLQPGDGAVLIEPPAVGWWEGVVSSCGAQQDHSLCHQTIYAVGPPSLLMLCPETAGLFCFVIIFFFSVCACWCFRIANFFYAQGRTHRRKNNNKKQGLITKFLFECLFLDSILSYLSLLETSAVCLIYLYHDFEYYKTSTVDF